MVAEDPEQPVLRRESNMAAKHNRKSNSSRRAGTKPQVLTLTSHLPIGSQKFPLLNNTTGQMLLRCQTTQWSHKMKEKLSCQMFSNGVGRGENWSMRSHRLETGPKAKSFGPILQKF